MMVCPYCQHTDRQVKAGLGDGAQRYKCMHCQRRYIPEPRQRGHSEDIRRQAQTLYTQGMRISQIASQMGVNPRSIVNWIRREADTSSEETNVTQSSGETKPAASLIQPIPGKKRSTIDDVATRAGVSNSTISNYLNNKGRMSAATRARVQKAMEELHFTPSALVRAIRQRRTQILGVYSYGLTRLDIDIDVGIIPPIVAGIAKSAAEARHNLLFYTGWEAHAEGSTGQEFLDGHIDGLIWVAPEMNPTVLERISAAGLPVIALLSRHVPDGVGYINVDNTHAMLTLVTHLVEQGHHQIAYIGPNYASDFVDRRTGYRQALEILGLQYDPDLDISMDDDWWSEQIYLGILDRWRALLNPPTAVMTADDSMAQRMITAAQTRGLRIPQDLAITGFNDAPNAQSLAGGLTTMRQPFRQFGELAVTHLLALIEGSQLDACRVTVPCELIVRSSTQHLSPLVPK